MRRSELLKASPPMFQSPWLDRFTRVHPAVPLVLYLPAICVLFALGVGRAGVWNSLGLAMGGYAVWTLTEYWLHRVVFHFEPERGLGARLHWMIHYHVHHHRPRTRVGRRLRELHMRHHFQDDERGFGVSAPYWDHVFGTPPEKRAR